MVKPLKSLKKAPYKECSTRQISLRQTLHVDRCSFGDQLIRNYFVTLGAVTTILGDIV